MTRDRRQTRERAAPPTADAKWASEAATGVPDAKWASEAATGVPDAAWASSGAPARDHTTDAFLGGAVTLLQPGRGYRAGLDAVLLAAAVPAAAGGAARILDVGAGVGAVGLCLATRIPDAVVTLIEREPAMAELARRNLRANGLADRARVVEVDIADRMALSHVAAELPDGAFDHVVANPPYHDAAAGTLSARAQKAAAHAMAAGNLDTWLRFLARMTRPDGTATVIHLATALPAILAGFAGRFGGLAILPVHPRPGAPATRVLVSGIKGSRAPLRLLPGFVLHGPDGHAFTPQADAILRRGAALSLA